MLSISTDADALAQILHDLGVRKNSYVALFMSNTPEMIFAICAVSKLGAAPAMINTALRSE